MLKAIEDCEIWKLVTAVTLIVDERDDWTAVLEAVCDVADTVRLLAVDTEEVCKFVDGLDTGVDVPGTVVDDS